MILLPLNLVGADRIRHSASPNVVHGVVMASIDVVISRPPPNGSVFMRPECGLSAPSAARSQRAARVASCRALRVMQEHTQGGGGPIARVRIPWARYRGTASLRSDTGRYPRGGT